jgi:hypothetical protein
MYRSVTKLDRLSPVVIMKLTRAFDRELLVPRRLTHEF